MYVSQPMSSVTISRAGIPADGHQMSSFVGTPSAKFQTTETFTTTHGFVIPSSTCNTSATEGEGGLNCSVARVAEHASTPVGWSGLLEISRATGGQGVVGSVGAPRDGSSEDDYGHIEVCCTAHTTAGVRRLVKAVIRGLKARQEPEKALEGMGGTYFFPNELGKKCAIFKPCDEEPLAPANPKGFVGRNLGDPGWKSTVRVGEAAMREVAAYLLDHDHFAQVPHTVLVQAQHPLFNYNYAPVNNSGGGSSSRCSTSGLSRNSSSIISSASEQVSLHTADSMSNGSSGGTSSSSRLLKLGSLQEFVHHIADTNEMGSSRFSTRDVHAIGILDIRLFNTDRHAGNILVREPLSSRDGPGSRPSMLRTTSHLDSSPAAGTVLPGGAYELVPIDHGFCLPEALEAPYFEWLHWPQACLPFSEAELAYIAQLDPAADIALLQRELPNLRPECLRVLEVATTFLKCCAAAGLTLADIGALASRPLDVLDDDDSCPSALEKACIASRQAVETRELAAMLSSSCSSDDTFTLREVDEELFDSDLEEEEEAVATGADAECQVSYHQQQSRGRTASRLARMCSGADEFSPDANSPTAAARASDQESASQIAVVSKSGSSELGSLVSDRTMATLATAMSLGSKGNAVEADLLFDLEEDVGSSASHTPSSSIRLLSGKQEDEVMEGASPSAGAGDCMRPMDVQQLAECLSGAQLSSAGRAEENQGVPAGLPFSTAGLPPLPSGSLLSPAPPAIARSVQMADGWMYRNLKAKPAAALAERCVLNSSKKATANARRRAGLQHAMYPPPVVRAAPKSANEVLSGLSVDQWAAFMAELQVYMEEALHTATGNWRRASQAAGLGGAAMSCPRF